LGSDRFVEKLKPYLSGRSTLRDVPRKQRLVDRPSPKGLFGDADQGSKARRKQLVRRARLQCGYTLSEIAAHLDIHYTTVSKVVNENNED